MNIQRHIVYKLYLKIKTNLSNNCLFVFKYKIFVLTFIYKFDLRYFNVRAKMTSSFSLFTSVLIYFILQYLKYQSVDEECNNSGKKSNVCSKVIYLFGVVLFVHRFERQPWRQTAQPFRLVFDVSLFFLYFIYYRLMLIAQSTVRCK